MRRTIGIGRAKAPRARRLDVIATNILQNDYVRGDRPGSAARRRDYRRWRACFAREALVAYDALEVGDRRAAIEMLCNVVCLEHAIALTGGGPIVARSLMWQRQPSMPSTAREWQALGLEPPDRVWSFEPHAIPHDREFLREYLGQWVPPVPGPLAAVDRSIALDSPLDPLRIGARRRIEPRGALPQAVTLEGMAPGEPARFEFTAPGQVVDLRRYADGWRVVAVARVAGDA